MPFGLVRASMAPNHQDTKNVQRVFQKVTGSEGYRYILIVDVGPTLLTTNRPRSTRPWFIQPEPHRIAVLGYRVRNYPIPSPHVRSSPGAHGHLWRVPANTNARKARKGTITPGASHPAGSHHRAVPRRLPSRITRLPDRGTPESASSGTPGW